MAKDLEMAKEADVGFMIWDAKSSGTISNAPELLEMGKKVLVYVGLNRRFETLGSMEDLQHLLCMCPDDAVKVFDQKFNLSNRLQKKPPVQLEMFHAQQRHILNDLKKKMVVFITALLSGHC